MADSDKGKTSKNETPEIPTPRLTGIAGGRTGYLIAPGMMLDKKYLVERELGRGGIGIVYKAQDKRVYDRPVVIKLLHAESDQNEWLIKKFRHESEALSRIDHPGIVKVYDRGELENGKPYFVMEFVKGETLRTQIKPGGMDFKYSAQILRQLGDALSAAHAEGVFHRDLKPENIMLQKLSGGMEQAKIIDFGIAKVKDPQSANQSTIALTVGTIPYMSPEQIEKGESSAASDIFSLAVIAYEMITGQRPFIVEGSHQFAIMNKMLMKQQAGEYTPARHLRPDLPEGAQIELAKALAFEVEARPKSAKEFTERLAKALTADLVANSVGPGGSLDRPAPDAMGEASTIVATPGQQPAGGGKNSPVLYIAGLLLVIMGVAGVIAIPPLFEDDKPKESAAPPVKRTLVYWLTGQKDPKRYPDTKPFRLPGNIIFEKGYQARIHLLSPDNGHLYVINEGPEVVDGLPQYNLFFPKPSINGGSARIALNQEVQIPDRWLVFDDEQGTEKFWIVWSAQSVPELEKVKYVVNPENMGAITKKDEIEAVQAFLNKHGGKKPVVAEDAEKKQTTVKGADDVLVHLVRIEHL